jgi:hypothetical protein
MGTAMLDDLKKALDAFTAYHRALQSYPASIGGQQVHFSVTLPALEAAAIEALCWFLGEDERRTLRDLLSTSIGDDEGGDDDESTT